MASKRVKDLTEKRMTAITEMRSVLDKAEAEKRAVLNTEEEVRYEALVKEINDLGKSIERQQRADDLEAESRQIPFSEQAVVPGKGDTDGGSYRAGEKYKKEFREFIKYGMDSLSPETRALSAGVLTEGGALIPPEEFVAQLLQKIDDSVYLRKIATVQKLTKSVSLGVPTLENDPADSDWTTELGTGSEDSTMSFGKRALTPHPLAKRIKESATLLRNSALPIETIIAQRLGYKFAITEEKAFLTGNGAAKPLGLFTASAQGISTGRDIQTGSATNFTFDGLIDAKFAIKEGYLAKAKWLFHRDALKLIAKLKDSQNQYLWQPNNQMGRPDVLLGVEVLLSEYVPNTFTTGLYVGMIADFSYYWIAENLSMTLQRLVELYAEANQIGFIGRMEVDGMPIFEEAFARLKTN